MKYQQSFYKELLKIEVNPELEELIQNARLQIEKNKLESRDFESRKYHIESRKYHIEFRYGWAEIKVFDCAFYINNVFFPFENCDDYKHEL